MISFTLTDPSDKSVAGVVSYDLTTNTAVFTPNAPLNTSTPYTATISGATDYYENPLTAPVSWSFTTSATATYTLWNNTATPATPSVSEALSVELEVLSSCRRMAATSPASASTREAAIRAPTSAAFGQARAPLLATATFTSETATGWQQVTFANPVAIAADTVYVAAYDPTAPASRTTRATSPAPV